MGFGRASAVVLAAALVAASCSGDDDGGQVDGDAGGSTTTTGATTVESRPPNDAVAVPDVEGPITGGTRGVPYNPMPTELATEHGYVEEEYFVRGEAEAYVPEGELGTDGAWTVRPASTAPYHTRILVRRPTDPDDFNGVLVVEWLNVSAGRDSDPDFGFLHPRLLPEGYAYVGVSAQRVSIEGGGGVLEVPGVAREALVPLKEWDAQRYAPLEHPGDEYSYDIFSQAAQAALRGSGDVQPLSGLAPRFVIAVGESQSAGRLATYVNAVHPLARMYDGFLVHSRAGGAAGLASDPAHALPGVVHIRTDLDEPVLQFVTETDLLRLGFLAARQPDSETVVTWEVAGTAHADASTLEYGTASSRVWFDGPPTDFTDLCGEINQGPQGPVLRAAFEALRAWIVDGTLPPTAPPIETTADDIVVDELGNARGGIRTSAVDVPIATLTGKGNPDSVFCSLFGQTFAFPPDQLAELYPSHDEYVRRVTASAEAAVDAGFLLPEDRDAIVADAEVAPIPT